MDENSLVVNDNPDPDLSQEQWPVGIRVRDEVNSRYYIEDPNGE